MAYLGNQPVVGDSANTFKLLDDISSFTLTFDGSSASVVSVANNTLTFANHRFVTGQRVTYGKGGGTVITGLTDATAYFIIKVDQSTIKLATNASNAASSTAIDLTGLGAGTSHTLKVAFDGVNTKFKATHTSGIKSKVSRAAQISLSINGVIQQPQDTSSPTVGYGVEADSTIVFSTAPVSTDKVFGSFIGEVAPSFDLTDNTVDNFTGDGSTTTFTLSRETPSSQDVLITLDGVTQHPSDASTTRSYSVVNQGLTFTSAPANGVAIQARHIGFAGATTSEVTGFYGRTGNVALTSTDDISVSNVSAGIITATTFGGNPSFTGSVSIGGTLTYEDVTNIDSVGLITARNGIVVGSGITLSKDGDVFATGIITASQFKGSLTGATLVSTAGLTVTGTGLFADDVSIADKIVHTTDTNTAIRFPASDKVTVETAGTERFAIEPAGNVNIPKSVVVGAAITVGSATSTSTFVGEGFLELTRSAGNSYIDFKDAFADDYDCRIITNAGNQLQFFTGGDWAALCALLTATGNVGISTNNSPSVAKLEVHSDKLGGTAGNTQELLLLKSPDISNSTTYRFTNYRHTNGTSHTQSELRFRRHVDVTDMAFFGLGDGYANIGYGTAEKVRIASDGKVGINIAGTDNTTPVRNLDIADASGAILRLISSDDSLGANERVGEIEFYTNDDDAAHVSSNIKAIADGSDAYGRRGTLTFGTRSDSGDASEKMRLTHNGQILMGGTSAYATFENSSTNPRLQVRGTDLNGSCQAWIRATSDAGAPKLFLGNTRSTSEGGHTVVQAGDELGQIHFAGSDGSQFVNGASIAGVVRPGTTPASDNVPGDLTFAVNHGSTGTTEQARISRGGNGGRFMINHTDTGTYNAHLSVRQNSAGPYPIGAIGQTTNQGLIGFFDGSGGIVGSIGKSGSNVTFNTSSDYRLKENAVSISDGITRLKSLKPYKFNFIDDSNTTLDGFFAHEVSSVVPEAVTGDKDGIITQEYIDEGKELQAHLGKPIIQSLDHSKLVPLLTAALQEAIVKIETLEAEVAALKG